MTNGTETKMPPLELKVIEKDNGYLTLKRAKHLFESAGFNPHLL